MEFAKLNIYDKLSLKLHTKPSNYVRKHQTSFTRLTLVRRIVFSLVSATPMLANASFVQSCLLVGTVQTVESLQPKSNIPASNKTTVSKSYALKPKQVSLNKADVLFKTHTSFTLKKSQAGCENILGKEIFARLSLPEDIQLKAGDQISVMYEHINSMCESSNGPYYCQSTGFDYVKGSRLDN